ncbi:MAG TPA: carboxypeptidase-like regulatory domain-containing protein [Bryobacteraceae bacterium]|nr:carboxypeptidase-like regulatory domain-containing protein [Bryobacteraceae bacterium]
MVRTLASLAAFSCFALLAQTNSGTILGTVRDSQDAAITSATVTVTNVNTGVSATASVTQAGQYTVPYLIPGEYSVSAEAAGFKKTTRVGLQLRVSDQLVIDIRLDVGAVTESVTVRSTSPLLESASVTLGQVVDTRQILDLPLNGRDAMALASLSPGVTPQDVAPGSAVQLGNSVPAVNGANISTSAVTVDGGANSTPRGTSYMMIYSPNVDSIAEFKVQTNSMSAEFGRTNGGSISMVTKSGTNRVHGTAYWFLRNRAFDANDFFSNRQGIPLGALNRHQAGATVGGPVVIPKLYDGRNKTFFFFDYEAFREAIGNPLTFTVPTALERTGDFSKTVDAQRRLVQIFDPLNTTPSPAGGGAILRQAFPGNLIPQDRLDPVARKMIAYYPLPVNGAVTGNLPVNSPRRNRNNTYNLRLDQYIGAHHFFGRGSWQQPWVGEPNYYGNIANPSNPPLEQRRRYAAIQDVYTLGPTLIVNLNFSIVYQYGHRTGWSEGFDITELGFPASFRDGQQIRALPVTSATGFTGLGNGAQNYSTQTVPVFEGGITKVFARQRLKAGGETRSFYNNQLQNSNAEGSFSFSPAFTQGPNPNQGSSLAGNAMASMLLGLPGGGSVTNIPATAFRSAYNAFYVQDDITLSRTLTLFAGLRWDISMSRTERFDRMSVLNLGVPSPIAPQVPGLNLVGQMDYRLPPNRRLTDPEWKNLGPRLGLAWRAMPGMVVRAAYGVFYGLSSADATLSSAFADGFATVTSVVTSLNDVNPFQTMSNPYPNGIRRPVSASQLTPDLNIGQSTNSAFLGVRTGQFQQWNFTVQREVARSWLLEAAYVGNKGSHTSIGNISLNILSREQLALGAYTQELIPNPFFGVITDPTSALSRSTVARRQLMFPYPQYTTITSEAPSLGSSTYHSFQSRVQKRFSSGFTLLGSYTIGKTLTNAVGASIADPNNLRAERSVAGWDVPQRFVISGLWELPFGRGKWIGSNWSKALDLALGRWQFNGIAAFQKGSPLLLTSTSGTRPNRNRPLEEIGGRIQDRLSHYFDTAAFSIPVQFTYGNAPPSEPDARGPGIANFDLSVFKTFRIAEKLSTQFRFESFNTMNRVQFAKPGLQNGSTAFGVISLQQNQPRKLQLALKMIF